jgi:myo-inositol catabolism protein IolC
MMVRIHDDDPGTLSTLIACAEAINALAARRLPAMIEVFASRNEPDALIRAITIAAGLGTTSAYTWLKLPVVDQMERVLSATTLPTVLLGGDPGPAAALVERWSSAMAIPQVRGLVVGRTLLYPPDGDVAAAVDASTAVLNRRVGVGARP